MCRHRGVILSQRPFLFLNFICLKAGAGGPPSGVSVRRPAGVYPPAPNPSGRPAGVCSMSIEEYLFLFLILGKAAPGDYSEVSVIVFQIQSIFMINLNKIQYPD